MQYEFTMNSFHESEDNKTQPSNVNIKEDQPQLQDISERIVTFIFLNNIKIK